MAAPYTFEELLAVLYTSADPNYLNAFFDGDYNNGKELFEQLLTVFQRVDEAVSRTAQSMYISPSSGQAFPPATGGRKATYEAEFTRSGFLSFPMTIAAGQVIFEEVTTDAAIGGGVVVQTGRQYVLKTDLTFLPGETGPKTAIIESVRFGYGFGNPELGSITGILQPGSNFNNTRASIIQSGAGTAQLVVAPEPDVITPSHVGQYVELQSGANAGQVRRVIGYLPVDAAGTNGGTGTLMGTFVGRSVGTAPVGTFQIGETVQQEDIVNGTIAQGVVKAVSDTAPWYIVVENIGLYPFAASVGLVGPITGNLSAASFHVEDVSQYSSLTTQPTLTSWRVLDWAVDWGLKVSNTQLLDHGSLPVLDALGEERGVYRSSNESDDNYRERVSKIADLITPNAVRRAGNRIWSAYGGTVCLREVGSPLFPGMFCEGDPQDPNNPLSSYAYDMDGLQFTGTSAGTFVDGEEVWQVDSNGYIATGRVSLTIPAGTVGQPVPASNPNILEISDVRGEFNGTDAIVGKVSNATFTPILKQYGLRTGDRFKLNLDYIESRAFFLVGVPPTLNVSDFGIPFDSPYSHNAFDASPALAFSDGFSAHAGTLNQATYAAIDAVRAAGVGFDLYLETVGCV